MANDELYKLKMYSTDMFILENLTKIIMSHYLSFVGRRFEFY